jgi:hypothetical protein
MVPTAVHAGLGVVVPIQAQILTSLQPESGEWLGYAVASDADLLVAGAPLGGADRMGSAHVYRWDGQAWVPEAQLRAAQQDAFDRFGDAVAVDGGTLAVFSRGGPAGSLGPGAVHIFQREAGLWRQEAKLQAPEPSPSERFGSSLAIDGDTLVAGNPSHDLPAAEDAGTVVVLVRDQGVWRLEAELRAPDPTPNARFGESVAIQGDVLLVGSPFLVTAPGETGRVDVFERRAGTWAWTAKLEGDGMSQGEAFGMAVDLELPWALVGAPHDDRAGAGDHGSAWTFRRTVEDWSPGQRLADPNPDMFDQFGGAVDIAEDLALVGARNDDMFSLTLGPTQGNVGADAGAVHIFHRLAVGWVTSGVTLLTPEAQPGMEFGRTVALGEHGAVAGAFRYDVEAAVEAGAVFVFATAEV